jgi:hypothetical protein
VPCAVAAVVAYGTARPPIDHRITASGPLDPRLRWWADNWSTLAGAAIVVAMVTLGQVSWSGERTAALAVPAGVGCVVAVAAAYVAVARFDLGPGVASGVAVVVTAAVTVLPYWMGTSARHLVIDVTAHNWMSMDAHRGAALSTGAAVWLALAGAAVVAAMIAPRDLAALSWTARARTSGD